MPRQDSYIMINRTVQKRILDMAQEIANSQASDHVLGCAEAIRVLMISKKARAQVGPRATTPLRKD